MTELHQVVLHGIACAAYILALLLFPSPSWDGLPGARPARGALAVVGAVTFLLVGLGTALLPHTTSCVLFFGFLVPAVGLVVLPRRVRRGPGPEARTQARLLFSTLVGGFAVAMVLGIVTVLLDVLGEAPGLTLVDPTAHGAPPPTPRSRCCSGSPGSRRPRSRSSCWSPPGTTGCGPPSAGSAAASRCCS